MFLPALQSYSQTPSTDVEINNDFIFNILSVNIFAQRYFYESTTNTSTYKDSHCCFPAWEMIQTIHCMCELSEWFRLNPNLGIHSSSSLSSYSCHICIINHWHSLVVYWRWMWTERLIYYLRTECFHSGNVFVSKINGLIFFYVTIYMLLFPE